MFALIALLFLGVFAFFRIARFRAEQRIAAADPLPRAGRLRGLPTLLLAVEFISPAPAHLHAQQMMTAIGASCRLIVYPGFGYGPIQTFDEKRILGFIHDHVVQGTPILFLHGFAQDASAWTHLPTSPREVDRRRVHIVTKLQNEYPCRFVSLGKEAWGNDTSLAELERQAGTGGKVALIGETTGAIAMWRWAERHPERVAALVGIMPVCDLQRVASSPLGPRVRRAYGSL